MTRIELERMSDLNKMITYLERKKEELFERQIHITQILSDMPKGNAHYDKLAEYVAQIEELDLGFAGVIAEHSELFLRYIRATSVLKDRERRILRMKYEDRMSWPKIARRMNYSESRCKGIHREAIEKIKGY